jgi:hypothetical protein
MPPTLYASLKLSSAAAQREMLFIPLFSVWKWQSPLLNLSLIFLRWSSAQCLFAQLRFRTGSVQWTKSTARTTSPQTKETSSPTPWNRSGHRSWSSWTKQIPWCMVRTLRRARTWNRTTWVSLATRSPLDLALFTLTPRALVRFKFMFCFESTLQKLILGILITWWVYANVSCRDSSEFWPL